jgi:hypothetical protein
MANLNKLKKYHFLYKTTNLLNGKFYIGIHSTSNLNDGYLGSGKKLRYSIRKYGKENFKLEILEFFDTYDKLRDAEMQMVNEDLLKNPMCMNLAIGGGGGNGNKFLTKQQIQQGGKSAGNIHAYKLKTEYTYRENCKNRFIDMVKECFRTGKLTAPNWTGKLHTEETKRKIGEANSKKQKGKANSQFGTMWITNGTENKKIKKEEIIPTGWNCGRFIK